MGYKEETLADRLEKAAKAKQAMLDKFKAKSAEMAETKPERDAARAKLEADRTARQKKRAEEKAAEAERAAKERAAHEAARVEKEKHAAEVRAREAAEKKAADAKRLIEQKKERDARYAARKARKK